MNTKIISTVLFMLILISSGIAATVVDKVRLVADNLVENQVTADGDSKGSWPNDEAFTGTIISGLLRAYEITGETRYLESAQLAGEYILNWSAKHGGTMYGEATFGLMQLSKFSDTPEDNRWRNGLVDFFEMIRNREGGTATTVEKYGGLDIDPSGAVFDLAHFTVSAFYVDAMDKAIWRNGLISVLINVEDDYTFHPVMGLGAGVWALSQTGILTNEIIDPFSDPQFIWYEVSFDELPGLLVHQQIPEGDEYENSFYWRFDHTDGNQNRRPVGGYVEDTVLGIKGLKAAMLYQGGEFLQEPLLRAEKIIVETISANGVIGVHLWNGDLIKNVYAGQLLQAVPIPGDTNGDDRVDLQDLVAIGGYWLSHDCELNYICYRANVDQNSFINLLDFHYMAKNYGKNYVTP